MQYTTFVVTTEQTRPAQHVFVYEWECRCVLHALTLCVSARPYVSLLLTTAALTARPNYRPLDACASVLGEQKRVRLSYVTVQKHEFVPCFRGVFFCRTG